MRQLSPLRRMVRRFKRTVARTPHRLLHQHRHMVAPAGAVALTFDDGPDPVHTTAILDELARLGIAATFFVVGQRARSHPEIVRRMIVEGHAVGSHSWSHPVAWAVPLRTLMVDYRRGRAEVERAAGRSVQLFRPPNGFVDAKGVVAMRAARIRLWLWTVDPRDWEPDVGTADILARLAGMQEGDVVLLHDAIENPLAPSALDRSATCAALAPIAALAEQRHLRFATLA